MGRSEWGLLVRSQQDMDTVEQLVSSHNRADWDDRGEDLAIGNNVVRFRGQLFMCIGNGGAAKQTSRFLNANRPDHMTIIWPFVEPQGWSQCRDYVDQQRARESLPATNAATDPIPGLEPCNPPARDFRDEMTAALMAGLQAKYGPANVQRLF